MDDRAIDQIFLGCLDNLPPVSSKIVRIFTSSTFTDMSMERNALMEDVYPRIKDYCREHHGLEFQISEYKKRELNVQDYFLFLVVDMRWGVRDEATDDHMTTDLCMREIENCQRLSMGPNFVTFLGQKYGYRPIPTIIDGKEFRMIREALILMALDVSLVDRWYREDTNAVPSVFVLQPISSILINFNNKRAPKLQAADQASWWDILEKLQKMLRKAAQTLYMSKRIDHDAMHNYMMSVTEREVINGILNVPNTRNHCLSYIRHINGVDMTNLRKVGQYIDVIGRTVDVEAQKLLTSLRDERLPAKIEASNSVKYTIEWAGKDGLNPVFHHEYLKEFTAHFYKHIIRLVDRAMRKEDLSSQGHIVTEILQHLHAAKNSVKIFQGREEELLRIQKYIQSPCDQPLVLHGKGGCGKTSLLAKGASMVSVWSCPNTKPILILRFLGTTPDSSSVVPMLTSVCQQIMYNYLMPWDGIPDDLIPLIAFLKRLLSKITEEQSLYFFLDSVDQLVGPNDSNKLSWLPARLPQNVKMVVSTVSEGDCREYRLMMKIINNSNQFIEVHPLGQELAELTIKSWLKSEGADLSKYQWKIVRQAISQCTLPIFIKLVFADVIRWKSYSKHADTTLAHTVMDSIMKLFHRIEMQHGRILVAHALSYITASKSGLSESELEDLISLDDIVLDDVYQYHMPPVRRIPPLLWTRIRRDLPNYLSERDADGVSVMNWYHRQFREAAVERYFGKTALLKYFHSSIADYFMGTWGGGRPKPFKFTEVQRYRFGLADKEGSADRKVPLQPLVFYTSDGRVSRYNRRKFGELPYHLVRSERFEDLFEHVLFNYLWLHSKISSCPLQAVLADFEDAVEHLNDNELIKELHIVADAIRLGGVILSQYSNMLASQISGRLMPVKGKYHRVAGLIAQCDDLGPQHCALMPTFHSLHTPGGPLKYSLEGHPFAVFGFELTSDSRFVLSASNKFLMFDLSTGEVSRDLNPDILGIMQTLVMSSDDKYAASYTNYDEIIILSVLSGDMEKIKNPFKSGSVLGISITETVAVAWSKQEWMTFDLINGKMLQSHSLGLDNYELVSVKYMDDRNVTLPITSVTKSEGHQPKQILRAVMDGVSLEDLEINGGLLFTEKQENIFVSILKDNAYEVGLYKTDGNVWSLEYVLGSITCPVLALEASPCLNFVSAITSTGFVVWSLSRRSQLNLKLPHNVRNISMKCFQSQSSLVITKHNQYGVGGVRKTLYVWNMKDGQLLKEVDAHFGRILRLKSLVVDDFNGIVSSSIDRTVKVWNVHNIFEKVHVIDRMEMAIDALHLAGDDELAIVVTRSSVGVWSISTGKLLAKLVDSPVGAIITHAVITADGIYVVSAESGYILFWKLAEKTVIAREREPYIKQLLLAVEDTIIVIISSQDDKSGHCSVRNVPSGELKYSFDFNYVVHKPALVTQDEEYLVVVSTDDERQECISVYNCETGRFLFRIPLKTIHLMGFTGVVSFPGKKSTVSLVGSESTWIVDIQTRKLVRGIKKWNGCSSSDGQYGLVAPTRGGLDIIELRQGKTVKVLIPPVSEGVFGVKAVFNRNDTYVIYYHSGRKTLRVFRVSDAKMIANYRLSAEASDMCTTNDGLSVVVGGVDGSFVVLAIIDPDDPKTKVRLLQMPSRSDDTAHIFRSSLTFRTIAKVTSGTTAFAKEAMNHDVTVSRTCVIS